MTATATSTSTVEFARTGSGEWVVSGPAAVLADAFTAGTPVTVTLPVPVAGERVYLGLRRRVWADDAATIQVDGLYRSEGSDAIYFVDTSRMDEAPRIGAAIAQMANRTARAAAEAEERARDEEARLERGEG